MSHGTITNFEESATVRFERQLSGSREAAWRALTDNELLSRWLAPATLEPRIGGKVAIDFGGEQKVDGTVSAFEELELVEYSWTFPGEADSVLRLELADGDTTTTRLVLEHSLLPPDQAVGYGEGWHAHLDSLQALLEGGAPVDWDERFGEVLGYYAGA